MWFSCSCVPADAVTVQQQPSSHQQKTVEQRSKVSITPEVSPALNINITNGL